METKLGTNINFVKMVDMSTVYDPIFHSPQFHILPITILLQHRIKIMQNL